MKNNTEILPTHLLGIETSGLACMVALSREGELLAQSSIYQKNIHSRRLAVLIDQLFRNLSLSSQQISAIGLSAGPGSFTGLRIGYSVAKGLAHSLNIPIVEVPTLDVWAYQHGETPLPVCAVINAHRQEIFCAQYRWEDGDLHRTGDYELIPLQSLSRRIITPTLFVGADVPPMREQIRKYCGEKAIFLVPPVIYPRAEALMTLTYRKYLSGETSLPETCEPRYMRAFKGVM